MSYSKQELDVIYARTRGRCHICSKKLARKNYGKTGAKAPWHVEHSIPRAAGGTDHKNNLFPACIDCNLEKSDDSTRAARSKHGRTRAPMSKQMQERVRNRRAFSGATLGGVVGWAVAPELMAIGAIAGAIIGHSLDVD